MFIFYFVYTKDLLICNENKEICVANLMIKFIYLFFSPLVLRINILGSSF